MAGETIKTEAVCLTIRPWSKTSHIVAWLTPHGKISTIIKGAVRPKSQFLGQYDLNYTCEIVYYTRARGDLHALRECTPVERRDFLRENFRAMALADYCRSLASELAAEGAECLEWYRWLNRALDCRDEPNVGLLVTRELEILRLTGLSPDFSGYNKLAEWSPFSIETGRFDNSGRRLIRVSNTVAEYLNCGGGKTKNLLLPLDAARVIGVFYKFHLDCAFDVRRTVLGMISNTKGKNNEH
jgi:recombinational DNA repair protein (RecF pathway)